MSRVLVIDDDPGTLLGYKCILRTAGHEVATAALGEDGVVAAERDAFDVVLCDLRLPDIPGLDVVRQIRERCPRVGIVLVTAWGTLESLIEAKRAGATSYAAKPLIGDDLIAVVEGAQRLQANAREVAHAERTGYAARRWALLVARATHLIDDPKTVLALCHGVGVARGTLKVWCRAAGVTAKDSLDLVRLLRVVVRHPGEPWDLRRRVDIIDERTAYGLMRRAGCWADRPVPNIESFLSHQQLITSTELVDALRERLLRVENN